MRFAFPPYGLIAHQGGRVDLKFRETDFGAGYTMGERVYIHERAFRGYYGAVLDYAHVVLERVIHRGGKCA